MSERPKPLRNSSGGMPIIHWFSRPEYIKKEKTMPTFAMRVVDGLGFGMGLILAVTIVRAVFHVGLC